MVDRYINERFSIDCFHTAFKFNYSEDFVFKGERHDFWEVTLIKSGKATVTQDENIYNMDSRCIIFHAPMVFHRIQSADSTNPTGYTFSFHTTGNLPSELSGGIFRLEISELEEFEEIMERLIPYVNEDESNCFDGQLVRDMISVFIIKLSEKINQSTPLTSEPAKTYQRIIRSMKENVSNNLALTDFATGENISLSYLKLLFNTYLGISPKAYYSLLRANEALRLLKSGASANEVSDLLNFSSPSYFTAFFKRHFGAPPKKYLP